MKKKIKEVVIRLIGDDGNLTHRLVNILSLLGALAFFVSGTVTLVEGQGMAAVLILYSCATVLLLAYFLAAITKRYEDCAFFIQMLLAIAIFPYTFFVSGGLDSGMLAWLVLGTVTAAFVLDGWRLFISLAMCIGADLFCFLYSYMHPEAVTGNLDKHGRYFDTVFSYLCVVFCLLLFLEIHKMLFRKEHDKNVKQQEELEAALSTQNRFLANISHAEIDKHARKAYHAEFQEFQQEITGQFDFQEHQVHLFCICGAKIGINPYFCTKFQQ